MVLKKHSELCKREERKMTFFLLFYSVFFQAEQGVAGPVCGRQASKEEPV